MKASFFLSPSRYLTLVLIFFCSFNFAQDGSDLGIGNNELSHRPNILVAWRNTERILEVEILVRNLGNLQGTGNVTLELCDEFGKVMLSTEPLKVSVPPKNLGGMDGTVVQMKGFRMLNIMFDQLDRIGQRYKLVARVENLEQDLNPLDNLSAKSFNLESLARSNSRYLHKYRFFNPTGSPIRFKTKLNYSALPKGWTIQSHPTGNTMNTINPNEVFEGYLIVETPKDVQQGEHADFLISAISTKDNKEYILDQDEWFLVGTNTPPEVSQPTIILQEDGALIANVDAFDPICGIKEASGVQIYYSLDHGTTFSTKVMAYTRGNFYNKTWFEARLGPFAEGTSLVSHIIVQNNAGISVKRELPLIRIQASQKSQSEDLKKKTGSGGTNR